MTVRAWDRRDDETPKAFAAFVAYRDQDPASRTLVEAAKRVYGSKGVQSNGGVVGRIKDWQKANEWETRAKAYDDHLDKLKQQHNESALIRMLDRHAQQASNAAQALMAPVFALAKRIQADPQLETMYADMDLDVLTRLADRGARGAVLAHRSERIARGLPGDGHVELTGPGGGPIQHETAERGIKKLESALDELAARREAREQRAASNGN